jgi:hypothetical protein
VDVLVEISLTLEELHHLLLSPDGPVMAAEVDLHFREEPDRLVDVVAPGECVAHLGATQGVDVVHVHGDHLRAAKRMLLGEVEGELRWGLGSEGHLEHDGHAVEHERLAGGLDLVGRWQHARLAHAERLAEADAHVALGLGGQAAAVDEAHPPSTPPK